jgi:chitosanase
MRRSVVHRLGLAAVTGFLAATPTPVVPAAFAAPAGTTTAAASSARNAVAAPSRPAASAAAELATPASFTATSYGAAQHQPNRTDGLDDPAKKEIAMEIVSSNENSSLDWRAQYKYIEDIHDGRGYTAGIIGFCSGTGDMLELVEAYTDTEPDNPLAPFLKALRKVNGSDSHKGLGKPFVRAWKLAAKDPIFQAAQDFERDTVYFNPAVQQGKDDGLGTLGQFIYYDAIVMHGPGHGDKSFGGIRRAAREQADTPADGGDETTYLNAFLDARRKVMLGQRGHHDTSRIDTEQRVFVDAGNLGLDTPLVWHVYGDRYQIDG